VNGALQVKKHRIEVLHGKLVKVGNEDGVKAREVVKLGHKVGEKRHECVIRLELVALLVDDLFELSRVKDVESGP